jgi:hypothetical protein
MATTAIPFIGTASGGELILGETLNRNALHVALHTRKGESAESVARRFVEALHEADAHGNDCTWLSVVAVGGTLEGLLGSDGRGDYFLAGTENGLGIPEPPVSLTACYDEPGRRVNVRWTNPKGRYDSIAMILNWHRYDYRAERALPGAASSYEIDLMTEIPHPIDVKDLDVWLVGYRANVPSNAAAIHVSGNTQEELFGIPFANGTAPNWTGWCLHGPPARNVKMGRRAHLANATGNRRYNPARTPDTKPYEQVMTIAQEGGGVVGVARSFLGLTPGHTYRISARLNTVRMEPSGDWSYSFHAVAGDAARASLTARQMAGLDALPDGSKGPTAARVWRYDAHRTTRGRYEERTKELTAPQGADCITVWLRFTSKNKGDAVAMDNIKLEDLGKQ